MLGGAIEFLSVVNCIQSFREFITKGRMKYLIKEKLKIREEKVKR